MRSRWSRVVLPARRPWALLACVLSLSLCLVGMDCSTGDPILGQGSIRVIPRPSGLGAHWVLRQGWGYDAVEYRTGFGEDVVTGCESGDYSLLWLPVENYADPSPNPENATLGLTGTLDFMGVYTPQPGMVVVNPDPDDIQAPWVLSGPDTLVGSGVGDRSFYNMTPGDYSVDWGDTAGWVTPSPDPTNGTLPPGGVLELHGTYTQASK